MRRLLVATIVLAVLAFFAVSATAGDGGCPCAMKVKGAKTEVKNIENGITVTITAADPAAVKEIQEKGAKMSAGGCPMMKEGAKDCGCQKAKEGKCPMMDQQQSAPAAAPAPDRK
jgi:TusA-related sulfurtransferase